jgi:outer membrane protein assembly factor BamB
MNAGTLRKAWTFKAAAATMSGQPGPQFYASPTVADGMVFIGANTGVFYALNLTTGAVVWKRFLGFQPGLGCGARGITSTAAVAPDPTTGNPAVYVGGGDGYLYALNASDGTVLWRSVVGQLPSTTQNDYYNWSSPVVVGGTVYDGVSSNCDFPFIRGGLQTFNQTNGSLLGSYWSVPSGSIGGGVWSSAATANGQVWVTTASGPSPPAPQGDMYSVVRIDGSSMARQEAWQIPLAARAPDSDFGSSPTLFSATLSGTNSQMVAACNKNGFLYAFRSMNVAAGPVWSFKVGASTATGSISCLAAPVWDGSHLFVAGNATSIGGVSYGGSMRQLDPATGAPVWQTGLAGNIGGTPSEDGAGVLAASMFISPTGVTKGTYLLNSSDGSTLAFLPTAVSEFSQPVWVSNYLLLAGVSGGLTAYVPASSGDTQPPSTPSGLTASTPSTTEVDLQWAGANDNTGVTGYRIFRNGGLIATIGAQTSYADTTAVAGQTYAYSVAALDAAGNTSPSSQPTTVTLPTSTNGPIFFDGFESGNLSNWTSATNIVVQTQVVDSGSYAARATSSGAGATSAYKALTNSVADLYYRLRFRVISQGANSVDLLRVMSGATSIATVYLTSSDALALKDIVTNKATVSTTNVSKGVWHDVEIEVMPNGGSGKVNVWLDGAQVGALSGTGSWGTADPDRVLFGNRASSRSYDIAFDNITVDNHFITG